MISNPSVETFGAYTSFPEETSCWIISDGKAGNLTQSVGVTEALGLAAEIKDIAPSRASKLFAPYGRVAKSEHFGASGSTFAPPWPDIAIACGRLTTPYIRTLRRVSGLKTYTVVLLDPKTGPNTADLFWVPEHDKRRGGNVITTLTSPHRFSPDRIAGLRQSVPAEIAALPQPRIAVLIGGPNGDYKYSWEDEGRLIAVLSDLAQLPVGLMITCSRRTPPAIARLVETATRGARRILFDGEGDNPYPNFLAHADAFVVTADSVNMVGEACVTGRPVHVFFPRGGSAKFTRFHKALAQRGATRPLVTAADVLQSWRYEPLYSATTIAAEIRRRYLRRRAVLGNLM